MNRTGYAVVDPYNLDAFAICDRCSMLYNHSDLTWQYEWVGTSLTNLRWLVCHRCLDVPNPQNRTIRIPPDPLPIENPRRGNIGQSVASARVISKGPPAINPETGMPFQEAPTFRWTERHNIRIAQQTYDGNFADNQPGVDAFDPGVVPMTLPQGNTQVPNTGTPPNPDGSDS